MTKFLDGPAAGVVLMIKRIPIALRVVRAQDGKWDALDQLDDKPAKDELIFVYRLVAHMGQVHLNRRGCGGGSGFYPMAEYSFFPEQPADEHLREVEAWRAWSNANRAALESLVKTAEAKSDPAETKS